MLCKMSKLLRANVQQCKLYLTTLYYIFELWPGGKSESSHYQKKKKGGNNLR